MSATDPLIPDPEETPVSRTPDLLALVFGLLFAAGGVAALTEPQWTLDLRWIGPAALAAVALWLIIGAIPRRRSQPPDDQI